MLQKLFALIICFLSGLSINAQVIIIDPPFPTADEPVTVYLNTTGTGLEDYSGDVYAHTGITVNGEQWQYVIAGWDENIPQLRMTQTGTNSYQLDITPTIREFYQAEASDDITELCFVFRSTDGNQQTSPDIFYPVYEEGLAIQVTLPEQFPVIVETEDVIHVEGNSSEADSTFLYVGEQQVYADTGSSFSYDIVVENAGKTWVKAIAVNTMESVADSFYYFVRPPLVIEDPPEGITDGINYINDQTVILSLYAPEKEYVFAWGDYSDWELSDDVYMNRTPDSSRYWIEISGLTPQQQYIFQYFIDGEVRVGDPYAQQVSDPWYDQYISPATYPNLPNYPDDKTFGIASVLQTAQDEYEWQVQDFTPPEKTDLIVYELLVRDFTAAHDFQTLVDTLDYLERIGINAIELMPTNEFEGNSSWGYNPNYYFAPDKYYGPRNTFKAFVDECHSRGIAVFADLVLNHAYGTCPLVMMYWDSENNCPAENNPWFNQESNFLNPDAHWGYDFNHESPETQKLVDSINSYWMSEYKIDGFRFDFTKGFGNNIKGDDDPWGSKYDADRIRLLERMADEIWERNPDAFVIFEHLAENSEEKELANYGILMWGNLNYNYNEGTMGYNENGKSDFSWISYVKRQWDEPNLVGYMESHDEQRLMFKNITYGNSFGSYDIRDTSVSLQREALAANFFLTIPGPKMIWQFGERGYDYTIDYNGRVGEKPPRWDYMESWERRSLYYTYASLIDLKKNQDVFKTDNFELDVRWAVKKIKLTSSEMSAVVLGNFDVSEAEIDPDFYFTGTWYEYWTGDSIEVVNVNSPVLLQAGEYRLYTSKKLAVPEYVGVDEENASVNDLKMELYPNPAITEVHIKVETEKGGIVNMSLFDITGKRIKEIANTQLRRGTNYMMLNIEDVHPGMYFLKMESEDKTDTKKLLIR